MSDHSKPSQYDPECPGGMDSKLIILIGAIGAVLLVVTLALCEGLFYNQQRAMVADGWRRGNPSLEAHITEAEQRLGSLRRIDGDAEHVTVPLDLAIKDFITENEER